ncbi:MAG: hypothetical protein ACLT4K_12875 [Catenibacterium sp.]
MRKDFGARALTYPQPVYMIGSFDKDDHPDLMKQHGVALAIQWKFH